MSDNVKKFPGGGPTPWANRACPIMSRPEQSKLLAPDGAPRGLDLVPCVGPACALWVKIDDPTGREVFAGCAHASTMFAAVQQLQATGVLIECVKRIADVETARIHIEHPSTRPVDDNPSKE